MSCNHRLTLSLLTATALAPSAHAANTCDALYNASIKSEQTPHRVYSTSAKRSGEVRTGEAIYAGGVEYLRLDGKWMRSPMTQQAMLEAAQEKLKTHPDTCTPAGNLTINGQAVSVYKVHDNESGTDRQVRILKSNGLLQGAALSLPDGSVVETRYEYSNVHAPAGVK